LTWPGRCWVTATTRSTLLEGLRSRATCANAGPHSGECKIHGKDGLLDLVGELLHEEHDNFGQPSSASLFLGTPWRCVRTPYFAPDGPDRPAETQLGTAVSGSLLARRKSGFKSPHLHPIEALVSGPGPCRTTGRVVDIPGKSRRSGTCRVQHPPCESFYAIQATLRAANTVTLLLVTAASASELAD
jgi:hypothetical protein